jgi:hypothetical protein
MVSPSLRCSLRHQPKGAKSVFKAPGVVLVRPKIFGVGAKAGKWHYHQLVDARRCSGHTRSVAWVVDLLLFDGMEYSHYQLVI